MFLPGTPTSLPRVSYTQEWYGQVKRRVCPQPVGDLGAAVAAHVEERPGHPVVATDDEDRAIGDLQGVEVARLAQVAGQRDDERRATEDLLHLGLPPLRVPVDGDRKLHLALGLVARAGVDVGQQPPGDVGVGCRGHVEPPLDVPAMLAPSRRVGFAQT